MSDPQADLDRLIAALEDDLAVATGRLLSRPELKAAQATLDRLQADRDDLLADAEAAADRIREAEAARDLLALAADEEVQAAQAEDALKRDMRRQDEVLLAHVERELKVYWLLIGLTFVVPVILVAPLGAWALLGVAFASWGFARMYKATAEMQGRTWVVFMDGVEEVRKKVVFSHAIAGGSILVCILWFVFALLRKEVEGG